ncbi:MAG: hypothetical protein KatS3mg095_0794 [Candidatus Parcubacteria bacterium]|nr:MAG: hypothetical protein KatS3mg095_0794 [Candidatus Parcubacteria bacterium]
MISFKLKIILLDGQEIDKEIFYLICKTKLGELTILANHQPIIAIVEPGEIIINTGKDKEKIFIKQQAVLEFINNQAKLLTLL